MRRKFLFKQWFFLCCICSFLVSFVSVAQSFSPPQSSSKPVKSQNEVSNLEGIIKIRAFLYQKGKEKNRETVVYFLQTSGGNEYKILFTDRAPSWLKTGMKIRIMKSLERTLHANEKVFLTVSTQVILLQDVAPAAVPEAFGPQKTIVMLVNFQDKPNEKPYTVTQVRDMVFNRVNNNYRESSYQQTSVVGDVIGWITIPINSTSDCTMMPYQLANLASNAARNSGVDLSQYQRHVFFFPVNFSCSWSGLGEIGGGPTTRAWLNGALSESVIAHELGHNLGLYHSHFLRCQGSSNQGSCLKFEYGDEADTMGNAGAFHFNAFQKDRLGWLNYQNSPPILTVTASGTYTIAPYETNQANTKAIKIVKKIQPNGSRDYFYLEFRQGIGIDAELASCRDCDFTRGVLVHQVNDKDADSSNLIDMSPNDNSSRIVALQAGRTFTDTASGVSFTVNSISSAGANVTVTIGAAPPPPPNPGTYDFIYPENIQAYTAGTRVLAWDNKIYKCKPQPASGWCSQSPFYYEPGRGLAWQMAWDLIS